MKTLIIAIDGISFQDLRQADDEHLPHLRWLMQKGCSGPLTGDPQPAVGTARAVGDLLGRAGAYYQTADVASSPMDALDAELTVLLESADDHTAVLIVMPSDFILSSAAHTLHGEIQGVGVTDIAATLLELGASETPAWLLGKSFLHNANADGQAETGYTRDEEEIVRERLQGLGYV